MKIACAAIKYRTLDDPSTVKYVSGRRHSDCIAQFAEMGLLAKYRVDEESGFMTDAGDFVDRKTAYEIAERHNQLIAEREDRVLYSEFVNLSQYPESL